MKSVLVVTGKHPFSQSGGDMRLVRIDLELLSQVASVRCVALSSGLQPQSRIPVASVPKPAIGLRTAVSSLLARRSLVHTRFDVPALVDAIRSDPSELILAEHTYMAESAFRATESMGRDVYLMTHVSESSALPSKGLTALPASIERRRIKRDEARCARQAAGSACYDAEQVAELIDEGARNVVRIDMILPPAEIRSVASRRQALFIGDRTWRPNLDAARQLIRIWPRIVKQVPGAKLKIVGKASAKNDLKPSQSIEVVGFVDDVEAVWRESSVLIAPVRVGGGVRVKILEAVAHGVPVVGTEPGVGSIAGYLPIDPARSDEELIDRAVELLYSPKLRAAESELLWEANRSLWASGFVQRQLSDWMKL